MSVSRRTCRLFKVTIDLAPLCSADAPWSLATVYGPVDESLKHDFLVELREIRAGCAGALPLVGDFNLIYQAADKSNDRLNL